NFVRQKIHLNVITRGEDEIYRYYHLHSTEIPVCPMKEYELANFVKTLLILQNIIFVNISLLYYASSSISRRQMEDSSTISSS
ncbi:663_t:CDS:2, partial [Funneliformis mosseae]